MRCRNLYLCLYCRYRFVFTLMFFILLVPLLLLVSESSLAGNKPPFVDPKLTSGEKTTYKVLEDGKVFETSHTIFREKYNGKDVYVVKTDTYHMILHASDLRPILIKKMNSNCEVELSIEYTDDRVHFIYPGPKRNKVEKIPEDRYDLHTIVEVVRGYPFGKKKVKFTLVTPEHIVDAYMKTEKDEKITVPAGTFDCYKLKGGISGLIGKVFGKDFFFWVEKTHPYRIIKQTDSNQERTMELVSCEIVEN
mgnify:CR=1 FL=1